MYLSVCGNAFSKPSIKHGEMKVLKWEVKWIKFYKKGMVNRAEKKGFNFWCAVESNIGWLKYARGMVLKNH